MHKDHDVFLDAIRQKKKVYLTRRYPKGETSRKVYVPLDHISGSPNCFEDKYLLFHVDMDKGCFPVVLEEKQIISIEPGLSHFEPDMFIRWDLNEQPWHFKRDWGPYS